MSDPIRFYGLKTCSTCRKAKKWLAERGVAIDERAIRDEPPSREELSAWIEGENMKPFLNTSSKDYREAGLSQRQISKLDLLDLTEQTPNLLKRPIAVWPGGATFGFKEAEYEARLAAMKG